MTAAAAGGAGLSDLDSDETAAVVPVAVELVVVGGAEVDGSTAKGEG